jgi:hypothetical protein
MPEEDVSCHLSYIQRRGRRSASQELEEGGLEDRLSNPATAGARLQTSQVSMECMTPRLVTRLDVQLLFLVNAESWAKIWRGRATLGKRAGECMRGREELAVSLVA